VASLKNNSTIPVPVALSAAENGLLLQRLHVVAIMILNSWALQITMKMDVLQ
jgi:hypothetical protein